MNYTEQQVLCSDVVKKKTKSAHAATEVAMMPMLKGAQTLEDYASILQLFYGFFAPLEEKLHQHITTDILPDIKERRSAGRILHDLKAIHSSDILQKTNNLPTINNFVQALGALYVLEGSTLGGMIIAKMLKSKNGLHITNEQLTFFNGYGEKTMAMWNSFKQTLNDTITTEAEIQEVVTTANQTFEKLKLWIEKFN